MMHDGAVKLNFVYLKGEGTGELVKNRWDSMNVEGNWGACACLPAGFFLSVIRGFGGSVNREGVA